MAAMKLFRAPVIVGVLMSGVTLLTFQNCSNVNFGATVPSSEAFSSTSQLTINKGAQFTNTVGVKVEIASGVSQDMYVTNDPTCNTGGTWQTIIPEIPWTLAETNGPAQVYAKFRTNAGALLPCISATIVHDNVPPVVSFVQAPGTYSRNLVEPLILEGTDAVSGIDHFECRRSIDTSFSVCDTNVNFTGVSAGPASMQIRAVDRAGNVAPFIERDWFVDRDPPIVTLTAAPTTTQGATLISKLASFSLSATDGTGSGVDHVSCQLDSGTVNSACPTTINYQGLTEGSHTFTYWAVDKAGNQSSFQQWNWVVQYPPAGVFSIIGITSSGGTDTVMDNVLATSLSPVVTWTASTLAVSYNVSILDSTGTTVICPAATVTTLTYNFGSTCVLTDSTSYVASVTAVTADNKTQNEVFPFKVIDHGPTITVNTPTLTTDNTSATITFSIVDTNGVASATCTMVYGTTTTTTPCNGLTTLTYPNLTNGPHTFSIAASDPYGNISNSTPVTFNVLLIVCDPLSGVDAGCVKGLQGDLYYLNPTQILNPFTDVDDYINQGVHANAVIYMSQVYVPTRSFEDGFGTSNGGYVVDNSGNKLVEWFALDLKTIVKLGPNDTPGIYQFALLTDDGSIMQLGTANAGTITYTDYINNDGFHSTTMKCDTVGMTLDATSRIPIRLKYFQGPKTEIAFTLAWRKVASATPAAFADPLCGVVGSAEFWGPNFNDPVNFGWGQLTSRGWKTLDVTNFELQTTTTP